MAKHNKPGNCWVILKGQVWDMSRFSHPGERPASPHPTCGTHTHFAHRRSLHPPTLALPGGAFRINPYCGKDITAAFTARHGAGARELTKAPKLGAAKKGVAI